MFKIKYMSINISISIVKLASLYKFPLAGTNLNGFISCSITEGMSITQEVGVVTHLHTVLGTPRIFLIGAGLAMLARALTGVLTQVRVQDVGICLFR